MNKLFIKKSLIVDENFQNHSKEILNDYHQRYSNKSKSKLRLLTSIASKNDYFYWLQQAKNLVEDTLNEMQTEMKEIIKKNLVKIVSQLTS
jgi:hypothetical protein